MEAIKSKHYFTFTVNAPHKINGKQLDVKKALPKDGGEQRGGGRQGGPGGRSDNWGGNSGMYNFMFYSI